MRGRVPRPDAALPLLLAALLILLLPPASAAGPRLDYTLHCQGCHGADGSGAPDTVPSLRGEPARFLTLPGGREYLIRVPGVSQSSLSDARVAEVLSWILREFSADEMPSDFSPFTAAEVARHRGKPLDDVEKSRRELLQAVGRALPAR